MRRRLFGNHTRPAMKVRTAGPHWSSGRPASQSSGGHHTPSVPSGSPAKRDVPGSIVDQETVLERPAGAGGAVTDLVGFAFVHMD